MRRAIYVVAGTFGALFIGVSVSMVVGGQIGGAIVGFVIGGLLLFLTEKCKGKKAKENDSEGNSAAERMKRIPFWMYLVILFSVICVAAGTPKESPENPDVPSGTIAVETPEQEPKETPVESVAVPPTPSPVTPAPSQQVPDDGEYKTPDEPLEELEEIDTDMTAELMSAGYSLEHASQIQEILNAVGIESIKIENMSGKAEDGLNAVICFPNGYSDRDRRFYFTTDGGVLFYAGFLDEDLYDSDKGGYLKSYGDVHVPETDIDLETYEELRELAISAVEGCLTVPGSASFSQTAWGVGRSDDHYQIIGRVTADNMYGVSREIPFSVWFASESGEFVVEGVALDGVRVE